MGPEKKLIVSVRMPRTEHPAKSAEKRTGKKTTRKSLGSAYVAFKTDGARRVSMICWLYSTYNVYCTVLHKYIIYAFIHMNCASAIVRFV